MPHLIIEYARELELPLPRADEQTLVPPGGRGSVQREMAVRTGRSNESGESK